MTRGCVLLEPGGYAAELFEIAEEALDEIALAIKVGRDAALDADAALGRDMRLAAPVADQCDKRAAVVASIPISL